MTTHSDNGSRQALADSHKLAIEAAMREAVRDAVVAHQRLGLPMVEWQDGRIVWIPADQLAAESSQAETIAEAAPASPTGPFGLR